MASIMEMSLMCRLCLAKDKNQVNIPIFEDPGDIRQIFVKISSCLPIKISRDDQLPKNICDGCGDKLELLYEFWNTSLDSEKTLTAWLKQVKDPAVSAVAQQISKPAETLVKEETDAAEASTYLEPAQESSINEEAEIEEVEPEEPPKKRARRTAAVKAQINIAPESDDEDDNFDNNMDEPDSVDADVIAKLEGESEESDGDEKDPSFADLPGTSTQDQPGTSGLGKDGAEAPSLVNCRKTKRKRFECPKCNQSFKIKEARSNHLKECHKETFQCDTCQKVLISKQGLISHMKRHLKLYDVKCEFCNKGFFCTGSLKLHINSRHTGKSKFICHICKRPCYDKTALKNHIEKHSNYYVNKSKVKCQECQQEFLDEKYLKIHQKKKHVMDNRFVCDLCGKRLYSKSGLTDHMNIHKGLKPHKCQLCGIGFANSTTLRLHNRRHTGEKPYKCTICAKAFTQSHSLKVHLRIHTGDKPFKCSICGKGFVSSSVCKSHTMKCDNYKL